MFFRWDLNNSLIDRINEQISDSFIYGLEKPIFKPNFATIFLQIPILRGQGFSKDPYLYIVLLGITVVELVARFVSTSKGRVVLISILCKGGVFRVADLEENTRGPLHYVPTGRIWIWIYWCGVCSHPNVTSLRWPLGCKCTKRYIQI